MLRNNYSLLILTLFLFAQIGCHESSDPTPAPQSTATPAPSQLANSGPGEMKTTQSGLKYQDLEIGDGQRPSPGQMLTVKYTGKFADGKEFDRGKVNFTLGDPEILKGWTVGIGGGKDFDAMKVGGRRLLIIPPHLAYGNAGYGKVPPGSTLTFEVELIKVQGNSGF